MTQMYEREFEAMPRDELAQLQIERLQSTLRRVYRNVAFYRHSFDAAKVDIESLRSIDDLRRLPFTTKEDLRKSYPYDMFAVPLRDIVRIHSSSGTTGKPIVVGYTSNDIRHWSNLIARQLVADGLNEHDVIQIAFNYSLFTGGLGFHYGAERIGASVIPASAGSNVKEQVLIMRDYKTSALIATPSYALTIANAADELGIHPGTFALKCGIFGAEPWSETMRGQIEERLHIKAFDTYGVSEIMGPGVSGECAFKDGLHVNEDHFIIEVIDPVTGDPRRTGETGELVFTTIAKEGVPMIRYRTGDLGYLLEGTCKCGRTTVRMSRVQGRTDDLIMAQGAKFFPTQVQALLLAVEWIEPNFRIILDRSNGSDTVEIQAAFSEGFPFFDELKKITELQASVTRRIDQVLGITARVTFVEKSGFAETGTRKGIEVIDRRSF